MPIQVTCPGCFTRFQVSEKFAGKKGPCPKCKKEITIPEKGEEVVIHAPDTEGPKDSKGRPVLKPIERQEVRVTRLGIAITVGAIVAAILAAVGFRIAGDMPLIARILGALLVAPPLVWAGYSFVRDQELEPYRGQELWVRVGICSAIFAALWLIYAFIPAYLFELQTASQMSYMVAGMALVAMIAIGGFGSVVAMDWEYPSGLLHAALYVVSTTLLALIAGVPLAT